MLKTEKVIKNILVVRNDRFGEFLLNIPALRALRETFTGARITAMVNPYVKELAECIPFVDEVWTKAQKTELKRRKFDIAVMLNPSKEWNLLTFFSGIPVRVGYDRKFGFLLTHKIRDMKYLGEKHEVEYNLDLVSLIGARTEDKSLAFNLSGGFASDFDLAIHPWTSDPIKEWPLANFRKLIERLARETDLKIAIIGGKEEEQKSIVLCSGLEGRVDNFTGKTTLIELAALLKKSRLLVSADSGPVHLAACIGTPVIALFRSDMPGKSARRWGPWGTNHSVIEKDVLADINVEEVLNKIREKVK